MAWAPQAATTSPGRSSSASRSVTIPAATETAVLADDLQPHVAPSCTERGDRRGEDVEALGLDRVPEAQENHGGRRDRLERRQRFDQQRERRHPRSAGNDHQSTSQLLGTRLSSGNPRPRGPNTHTTSPAVSLRQLFGAHADRRYQERYLVGRLAVQAERTRQEHGRGLSLQQRELPRDRRAANPVRGDGPRTWLPCRSQATTRPARRPRALTSSGAVPADRSPQAHRRGRPRWPARRPERPRWWSWWARPGVERRA